MSTPDIAAYLMERIAEDERIARYHYTAAEPHIARDDPAQVIAECEARRTAVQHCQWVRDNYSPGAWMAEEVLQHFVQAYRDRPDFPPEWLPEVPW